MNRKVFLATVFCLIIFSSGHAMAQADGLFEMDNPSAPEHWLGAKSPYNYGNNYLRTGCTGASSATTSAVFDSSLSSYGDIIASSTGLYSVYARWISLGNSTRAAAYLIYDGTPTGSSTPVGSCAMDQTSRTGEWIYCTTVTLTAGNNAYVALGNNCEKRKVVVADAVRFVKHFSSLSFKGVWNSAATYNPDDVVSYNGAGYVCLRANTGNAPDTSTTVWTLLAQNGAQGPKGDKGDAGQTGPQGAPGPPVKTVAVCVSATEDYDGYCSCERTTISHVTTPPGAYGNCTATSDTGNCSAGGVTYWGSKHSGQCCVCAY
jgi:hypothetical protein